MAVIVVALVGGAIFIASRWIRATDIPVVLQLVAADIQAKVDQAKADLSAVAGGLGNPSRESVAAFSGVRWKGDLPQVQVNSKWYDLIALNDQAAPAIVAFAKSTYGLDAAGGLPLWQKRFAEDMGQVMTRMGHPLGDAVKLDLADPATHQPITLPNAPMTENNRRSILVQDLGLNPAAAVLRSRGMPFSAIRWRNQTPEIFIKGKWYELVSLDGMPARQFIDVAKAAFGPTQWERRFPEDLANVLAGLNKPTGAVDLQLKTLDTNQTITITNVPMDEKNRTLNMFGDALSIADFSKGTLTFFSAVQWKDDTAQVQVNGNPTWYELLAIDDVPAATIFDSAKQKYGDDWKKQIEENSVALMLPLKTGYGSWLKLRPMDTDETVSLLKLVFPPVDISRLQRR